MIESLAGELNGFNRERRILSKISDELPMISAKVCDVELFDMITGSRKGKVILALKFVYKELYENHNCSYQSIADRFNREDHGTVRSNLKYLNNRLETKDPETVKLYQEFRNEVDALRIMLTL